MPKAGPATWLLGGGLFAVVQAGPASAFPFVDPSNRDSLPSGAPLGTELPSTDASGLRNQLRLTNPAAVGNPGAWTIMPRVTLQELFTDNAFEVTAPRRADAITVVSPGITILADTSRIKLNLDYQPNLIMHAINGPLNAITQQLTAIGIVTVVPDLAYVDVRAVSGVQSRAGALAGTGTLGAQNVGLATTAATDTGAYGGQGLNRRNAVQTSSFGISPYLLRQFGDIGTGKLGVSVDVSRSSSISGFVSSPFPTGGTNSQTALTTEEYARFTSGQFLEKFQYTLDIDFIQSRSQSDAISAIVANTNTTTTVPGSTFTSDRQTINNQLSYALDHTFTLLASVGVQRISYNVPGFPNTNGLIWSAGFTYSPAPDAAITVTYGRQNGTTGFNANAYFPVGSRSLVTFSYANTIGTQLENLQSQLNNSAIGQTGALINAQTGGPTLVSTNALGVQSGVFRFRTATASWITQWPRDTLQATLSWSEQTSLTPSLALSAVTFDPATGAATVNATPTSVSGPVVTVTTGGISWLHELSPDLIMSSAASYSFIHRSGNINDSALTVTTGLQYTLSPTTLLSARYSFFDRISRISGYSLYENLLLLGVTKQF